MNTNVSDFLVELASNPDRLERFRNDPRGEIERAGLTENDKAAILAYDSQRVVEVLGDWTPNAIIQVLIVKRPPVRRPPVKKPPVKKPPVKRTPARRKTPKRKAPSRKGTAKRTPARKRSSARKKTAGRGGRKRR